MIRTGRLSPSWQCNLCDEKYDDRIDYLDHYCGKRQENEDTLTPEQVELACDQAWELNGERLQGRHS